MLYVVCSIIGACKHVFSLLASIAFFLLSLLSMLGVYLSSFTFSDTFANSISRFNHISADFNSLPEIKVGTISARDYLWQSLR